MYKIEPENIYSIFDKDKELFEFRNYLEKSIIVITQI